MATIRPRVTPSVPTAAVRACSDRLLGMRDLDAVRRAIRAEVGADASLDEFLRGCMSWLGLSLDLLSTDLERVPAKGPVMVCCNHPTGAMEGLLLLTLLRAVRQDVRVLANAAVRLQAPELDAVFLPMDSADGQEANAASLRQATRWLQDGGCLLAFPAGSVASAQRPLARTREAKWQSSVIGIQRLSGAAVVPAWVDARSPLWFRAAASLHPRLRTALLPRLLLAQREAGVAVRIGFPIPDAQLQRFCDDNERAKYLRLRCEILARRKQEPQAMPPQGKRRPRHLEPLPEPVPVERIEAELRTLPPDAELVRQGSMRVLCAGAAHMPNVLREIGRLRELTFRGVGEGSGAALDLDAFDQDYQHLVLWDESRRAIVGAYRLGDVRQILAARGAQGLYTSSLYRYRQPFLDHVQDGVELGRSFVQPAYQKGFLPLLLLWKGIAAFVQRDPRRRQLFGTVSISADHHATSVRLMVDHLSEHCFHRGLAGSVRPIRPWRRPRSEKRGPAWQPNQIAELRDVSAMVREIEVVRQGVPVLLEQYLKLGAKVVGINVDAAFHTIDALVVVDLAKAPLHLLARYMGENEAKALQARFRIRDGDADEDRRALSESLPA